MLSNKIKGLLATLAIATAAHAQVFISDSFNDGNIATNVGGVGHGFVNNGQATVTESGGVANFVADGYSTQVIRSNGADAFNPFQSTSTEMKISFGSLGFDGSFDRQWFSYQATGQTSDHAFPNRLVQGLYVSILYGNAGEDGTYGNATAHKGNLVAVSDSGVMTTLASWDWETNPTTGFEFSLITGQSGYSLSFTGASVADFATGAASGALTGLGTISNNFDLVIHGQTASGGANGFTLQSVSVAAVPEPASWSVLCASAALATAGFTRRRRR